MSEDLIREATLTDVPRVVELGRKFLAEGPYAKHLADNPAQATHFTETLVANPQAKILVSEHDGTITGVFGFLISPHYLSGDMTAMELIWYVEPRYRPGGVAMRLMWEAEKLAFGMGAQAMGCSSPDEKAAAVYRRFGYHPVETYFLKELKCQSFPQ